MRRRLLPAFFAVLFLATVPVVAQGPPDPRPAIAAVQQVAFLEGKWSGEGWAQMGPGPKEAFTQTETVELKLDGAVMVIEGVGYAKGETSKRVHHALAVVSFDPAGNSLVFSSFLAGRPRLDVVPEVGPNTFKWSFSPSSGAQVRYSIAVENDTWSEIGEYSSDGKSWHQFFEMHLTKE